MAHSVKSSQRKSQLRPKQRRRTHLLAVLFLVGLMRIVSVRAFLTLSQRKCAISHPRLFKSRGICPSCLYASSKSESKASKPRARNALVIVESPSKCKTIEKLLSEQQSLTNFTVAACKGHIRDMPASSKTAVSSPNFPYAIPGINLQDNYRPLYEIIKGKEPIVRNLKSLAKKADIVYLATDPDREGEAMAWHLAQLLGLKDPQRLSFTEITSTAIHQALNNPLQLNPHLIASQETRRIVDRLAGFTLSPILWRKISPGLSAGRVQSVAMAVIVNRERERLRFEATEYWDLKAVFRNGMEATLVSVNDKLVANKASDYTSQGRNLIKKSSHKLHLDDREAKKLALDLKEGTWTVVSLEQTRVQQKPPPPFTTSTLQQEAHHRFGWSATQTMRVAQELYEDGHISYMRTDSTQLSKDADTCCRREIVLQFSDKLVSTEVVGYRTTKTSRFSQEAHEAIRPSIVNNAIERPESISASGAGRQLYHMVYCRTLASRMTPLVTNRTSVALQVKNGDTIAMFRASGSVVLELGYTVLHDRPSSQELPPLHEGQVLNVESADPVDHQTLPPPRYNDASLVKELEALGVGRPSTYAKIVQVLRNRAYVGSPSESAPLRMRNPPKMVSGPAVSAQRAAGGQEFVGSNRGPLVPSLSAFVVTDLLEKHCPTLVDPKFTARMEARLDEIASGEGEDGDKQRVEYLNEFYAGPAGLAQQVVRMDERVHPDEVRRVRLPTLEPPKNVEDEDIALLIGPWGPYVRRINNESESSLSAPLPSNFAADLSLITTPALKSLLTAKQEGGVVIGQHPNDGRNIRLKTGRFGAYLQWGDDGQDGTTTHSLPRQKAAMRDFVASVDENGDYDSPPLTSLLGLSLKDAVSYVSLPRQVSVLNGLPIVAAIGPYGPYLKYNNSYVSLSLDVFSVDAERAEILVKEGAVDRKRAVGRGVVANLGDMDGSALTVKSGRFGDYLNWKKVKVKIPPEHADTPASIPLEEAWALIQQKFDPTSGELSRSKRSTKPTQSIQLPLAPKRPLTAYLLFCADKRSEAGNMSKSLGEVSKRLAALWADANAEVRKPYQAQAEAEQAAYAVKKDSWNKKCKGILTKASKSSAKLHANSPRVPKKPKNAYMYFCDEFRAYVAEKTSTMVGASKELARMWADTPDRRTYEELAQLDKKRYEAEKAKFGSDAHQGSSGSMSRSVQAKPPKSRPPSAYMLFCREMRGSLVDMNGNKPSLGDATKQLAVMWKECDSSTKGRFQQLASVEKAKLESAS